MNIVASNRLIPLYTEALECFFETDTGFIRRIRVGNIEVIRAIYGAVRDHNWATILPAITVITLEQEETGSSSDSLLGANAVPSRFGGMAA
jgi:hypothetical protein